MGTMVMGKSEAGLLKAGDTLLVMPNKAKVKVEAIYRDEKEAFAAKAGENLRLRISGAGHHWAGVRVRLHSGISGCASRRRPSAIKDRKIMSLLFKEFFWRVFLALAEYIMCFREMRAFSQAPK